MGNGRTRSFTDDELHEPRLPVLGQGPNAVLENVLNAVDTGFNTVGRLYANPVAADAKVYITASQINVPNGAGRSCGPIGTVIPVIPLTTIDFQTQATTGGTVVITWPSSTPGRFRRAAFTRRADDKIEVTFSGEFVSLLSLPNAGTMFVDGDPMGWIDLECTNIAGRFKTAGSASNVIENAVGGASRIVNIIAGGGGGSSGSQPGVAREEPIGLGVDFLDIVFPVPLSTSSYVPEITIVNLVDGNPIFLQAYATLKTNAGFRAVFNAPTDSANYVAGYVVPVVQKQIGEVDIPLGVDNITIPLPITLTGTMYVVIGQVNNYLDPSPTFLQSIVVTKVGNQFVARWNALTDSTNYKYAFHVAEFT